MDNLEINIQESILNIRNFIDSLESKNKKKLEKDLDYIEDSLESLLNYVYAENDNLEELKTSLIKFEQDRIWRSDLIKNSIKKLGARLIK